MPKVIGTELVKRTPLPYVMKSSKPPGKRAGLPIDDLPHVHPCCHWCGRPLKSVVKEDRSGGHYGHLVKRTFQMWAGVAYVNGVPLFDLTDCATAFAREAFEKGHRHAPQPSPSLAE